MNVLILDDAPAMLQYYKAVMGNMPNISKVSVASDEESFKIEISKGEAHMIMCDIHMQGKEGPDILRDNKGLVGSRPVILVSCADTIQEEFDQLARDKFNMMGMMRKPVTPLMLADLLGP